MIDRLFKKLMIVLGSTPVILISIAWCVYAYLTGSQDFLDIISMVTFIFGELILRGQNVQAREQDRDIKSAERATKRIEKKL